MREAFALQKLLTFFWQKNIGFWNSNKRETNNIVSFEELDPEHLTIQNDVILKICHVLMT